MKKSKFIIENFDEWDIIIIATMYAQLYKETSTMDFAIIANEIIEDLARNSTEVE